MNNILKSVAVFVAVLLVYALLGPWIALALTIATLFAFGRLGIGEAVIVTVLLLVVGPFITGLLALGYALARGDVPQLAEAQAKLLAARVQEAKAQNDLRKAAQDAAAAEEAAKSDRTVVPMPGSPGMQPQS